MDGADGINSDASRAGGHRFDPGHVHQHLPAFQALTNSAVGRLRQIWERLGTIRIPTGPRPASERFRSHGCKSRAWSSCANGRVAPAPLAKEFQAREATSHVCAAAAVKKHSCGRFTNIPTPTFFAFLECLPIRVVALRARLSRRSRARCPSEPDPLRAGPRGRMVVHRRMDRRATFLHFGSGRRHSQGKVGCGLPAG
jgi:hypothetical protein